MPGSAIKKTQNGDATTVARLFERYGIDEGVRRLNRKVERRITERTLQLEAVNEELERVIAEHRRMEGKLRSLALTDDLTGLYNRRGFLTLAGQQMKLAHRMGSGLSLVYADLDGLKWINDTFGHDEGDGALRETARILRETFRDSDIIARLGGDEFTVLVMQTSDHSCRVVARRLQEKVAGCNAQRIHPYELSLSVGVAHLDPENPVSIGELTVRADEEMYAQKRNKQKSFASRRGGLSRQKRHDSETNDAAGDSRVEGDLKEDDHDEG